MKIRITLDDRLAHAAIWALAAQAANLAKHTKDYPNSPFEWERYTREANDQTEEFRKAVGNAELVEF